MNIHINTLAQLVAVRLGEYPDYQAGGWKASSGSTLTEIAGVGLEYLAQACVKSLPLNDCSYLKDFSKDLISSTDWGLDCIYCCKLPDDFFRLHTLRMPDWPTSLSEEFTGDRLLTSLGDQAPEWMRLRPLTPMLYVTPDSFGEGCNLWFGPTSSSRPVSALYVPRPVFNPEEGVLSQFQPDAVIPLADKITEMIRTSES